MISHDQASGAAPRLFHRGLTGDVGSRQVLEIRGVYRQRVGQVIRSPVRHRFRGIVAEPDHRTGRHQKLGLALAATALLLSASGCGVADDFAGPAGTPASGTEAAATPEATRQTGASPASSPSGGGPPAASPIAFESPAAAIGPLVWAAEIDPDTHAPLRQVTSFVGDAPFIYATVAVQRVAAGTTIDAQWTYNRTRLEGLDAAIVIDAPSADTWIEFHLSRPSPGTWPSGIYEVAIQVNGQPAVTGSVEINDAEST